MFDTMVGLGFGFGLFMLLVFALLILKRHPFDSKIWLYLLVIAAVVAVALLELGWATAEIGRQPWIVYDVLTVSGAANTSPSVVPIAILFIVIYMAILPFTVLVIKRLMRDRPFNLQEVKSE